MKLLKLSTVILFYSILFYFEVELIIFKMIIQVLFLKVDIFIYFAYNLLLKSEIINLDSFILKSSCVSEIS